ncbi:MAG: MFS transporter [Desulfobacterales bacterium]|jgi:UMF1 family MFS transporter
MSIIQKLKSTKREHLAWYLYDFGNSAYAAVILLAVYSAYFKGEVVGGAEGSRLWGYSVGIAMLVVSITSPILGAIADFSGSKKRFLLFYSSMAWLFTGLLFFVQQGEIILGMTIFILAEIGYRSGQVFYNSLLPEIAEPEEMGRVSGNAWAIGSAGGILALVIILPLIIIFEGTFMIRLSFVFTALYFAASALPAFLWIKEKSPPQPLPSGISYLTVGFERIVKTARSLGDFKDYIRFLIAFLIYNDGILMALNFAAIIGAVLFGMEQQQLIVFMILVQVTSVFGAFLGGVFGDRLGYKRTLIISLVLMMAAVAWMIFAQTITEFYFIGGLAGFALTGVQSISRTLVGMFAPKGKSAEFYGFFAVTGRTSSFIGPTVYGFLAAEAAFWFERRGVATQLAEQFGQRVSIGSIMIFLLAGLIILLEVKDPRKELISS